MQIQDLCCDNTGKNVALKSLETKRARAAFEYTIPGMPQQNGCIE